MRNPSVCLSTDVVYHNITLCGLVSSADNICKKFGPRSGPTERRAWSGSKMFDTLMEFLEEFFKKVELKMNYFSTKKYVVVWDGSFEQPDQMFKEMDTIRFYCQKCVYLGLYTIYYVI